jgi:ribosomal protein S8
VDVRFEFVRSFSSSEGGKKKTRLSSSFSFRATFLNNKNFKKNTSLQVARLLPSRLFGVIVLTTSAGIMDHEEARRKKVGGKVLGFFY